MSYPVTLHETEDGVNVVINGREIQLATDWEVGDTMMTANVNGDDQDISIHVSDGYSNG